jgi:general secretion pathway protein B
MSYILEALKKAQAERQLGNSPTIHAPVAAAAPAPTLVRKPLVAGAGVGALLALTGLFMWHQQPARVRDAAPAVPVAAVVPATVDKPARAPVPKLPAVAKPAPALPASSGQVALVGRPDPPPKPAPAPAAPAVAKPAVAAPVRQAPVTLASAAPAVAAAGPAPTVAAAVPSAAPDDGVRGLNELPEAVRRDLPKVAFGGYMYSPNPADRLVLVDNVLRREGEQVAPGLVLEKLLPKGAVMSYRGYRYRVAF